MSLLTSTGTSISSDFSSLAFGSHRLKLIGTQPSNGISKPFAALKSSSSLSFNRSLMGQIFVSGKFWDFHFSLTTHTCAPESHRAWVLTLFILHQTRHFLPINCATRLRFVHGVCGLEGWSPLRFISDFKGVEGLWVCSFFFSRVTLHRFTVFRSFWDLSSEVMVRPSVTTSASLPTFSAYPLLCTLLPNVCHCRT